MARRVRDRVGGPKLHVTASRIQDGDTHAMNVTGPLPHGRGSDRHSVRRFEEDGGGDDSREGDFLAVVG